MKDGAYEIFLKINLGISNLKVVICNRRENSFVGLWTKNLLAILQTVGNFYFLKSNLNSEEDL